MGYRVLRDREIKWQPRRGLEGPFFFSDHVLYYDPKEGQYWDPTTDFYVSQEEMNIIHSHLLDKLVK